MTRRFRMENFTCPGCAAMVEEKILSQPGVDGASIDLERGVLTLEDDGRLGIDSLRKITSSVESDAKILEFAEKPDADDNGAPRGKWTELAPMAAGLGALALLSLYSGAIVSALPESYRAYARLALFAALYISVAAPVLSAAWRKLFTKNFLNEHFLMSFASVAAFAIGEYPEAVGVMIFYRIGETLEDMAAARSRRSVKNLLRQKPSSARVLRDGRECDMNPEDVKRGDIVLVKPGEKIPVDGVVAAGSAQIDASPLTGEAVPVSASEGDSVYGGSISLDGAISVEASGDYRDSTIAKIMEMVENAVSRKSPTERFITAFARRYTPIVVGLAVAVALAPPLAGFGPFSGWLRRALVLLVISCPCALVISIPLGYFGGIGAASRRGILVKGGSVFDALQKVRCVFFDKTGTLTKGVYEVAESNPADGVTESLLGESAAMAEDASNHPVARSIKKKFSPPAGFSVIDGRERANGGITTVIRLSNGTETKISVGNASFIRSLGANPGEEAPLGTVVHAERDGKYLGNIVVTDAIRPESAAAIGEIRANGVPKVYMLTGDREQSAKAVASGLNLSGYRAGLLPDGKVSAMEEIAGSSYELEETAFVGDGVNDAPALAASGVGIAMGGLGSQTAVEIADAVILDDSPARVPELLRIAKFTRNVVRQNIAFSIGAKVLFMALGALGAAGLWEAIFADVGVAILAVLNASRTVRA